MTVKSNNFGLLLVNGEKDRPDAFSPLEEKMAELGIKHQVTILPDTPHNLGLYYARHGSEMMDFLGAKSKEGAGKKPILFAAEERADRAAAEASTPPRSHETFDSEVLKVFSAKDGDAVFRAYLVKWKGEEIVASDPLVMTDYQVGDARRVLAINLP